MGKGHASGRGGEAFTTHSASSPRQSSGQAQGKLTKPQRTKMEKITKKQDTNNNQIPEKNYLATDFHGLRISRKTCKEKPLRTQRENFLGLKE